MIYNLKDIGGGIIIEKTCGEGLNSKIFVNYLKDKYYKLYDV